MDKVEAAEISTHTPVRVWPLWLWLSMSEMHFNSHTREGVTTSGRCRYFPMKISTHTPVRVWQEHQVFQSSSNYFNSHTREGVTLCVSCFQETLKFQLTHPWGCDAQDIRLFQLRHNISTHTPVRVWPGTEWMRCPRCKFQLTHPWGCDGAFSIIIQTPLHFNSHTREGVTFLLVLVVWV